MDSSRPVDPPGLSPDVIEFVRFCYRRRPVGWPELYDEMCAVAGRGLYRGWRFAELADHGIGFSLYETPDLARIAGQVLVEEGDRRLLVPGRSSGGRRFVSVGSETPSATVAASVELEPVPIAVEFEPIPAAAASLPLPRSITLRESSPQPDLVPTLAIGAASAG